MQFRCRLGTPDGQVVQQVHRAPDAGALRRELQRKGFHVFELRRQGLGKLPSWLSWLRVRPRSAQISTQRFLVFNQELAALLGAGLPLLQSLDIMLERLDRPAFRALLEDIRRRVASGEELSTAFEAHSDKVPRLYPSSLKAGERSGDLEKVIRRFVRYLKLVIEARRRVVSALVYPAVLVALSIGMIVVMTVYVVPNFSTFYEDVDAELPLLTKVTVGVGTWIQDRWLLLTVALVAGSLLLWRWSQTASGRVTVDRWKLSVPILGEISHKFALAEFCRALATLLEGGLPLVPSLEIAIAAVGNAHVRSRLTPTIQKVREGEALYEAADESGVVEDVAIDMIRVGEATGALDDMLHNVADFLDQEVETRLERILTLIEPLMLVFMGVIIAILLISVYLPMFSVMGEVR